jgi:23S rRNA (uracil1939-C5)-methyltransferase
MQRIGGIDVAPAATLVDDERCFGYRNRALIPLKRDPSGRLKAGYFRPKTHKIVNLNHCPVLDPRLDALVKPLKQDLDAGGWPADHDLLEAQGLRHLGLRLANATGDVLITLISSHAQLRGLEDLAQSWVQRWPAVKGVCLNLQPKANNLVLGRTTHCLAGVPTIEDMFCGIKLSLSSTTFVQVNTPQAERIVQLLSDWLSLQCAGGHVVDAYCGVGTIALPLAKAGFVVQGLELNPDSVEQARLNAMHNGLSSRCAFHAGDVADLLAAQLEDCQALVLDPPRRGLDRRVVDSILEHPPGVLAYLSCDPATQARDLKALLCPSGPYELEMLQPVDFFPQTTHLESLALLKRISS